MKLRIKPTGSASKKGKVTSQVDPKTGDVESMTISRPGMRGAGMVITFPEVQVTKSKHAGKACQVLTFTLKRDRDPLLDLDWGHQL